MADLTLPDQTSSTIELPFHLPSSISADPGSVEIIRSATKYVESHMSSAKYDSSHDFTHIKRVISLSLRILEAEQARRAMQQVPSLDETLVVLGALMHDVFDKKYQSPAIDETQPSRFKSLLRAWGAGDDIVSTIEQLCESVSYSFEISIPKQQMQSLIQRIPELAVVQDADRLDALGAIGIGRCFTFSGAKGRSMEDAMNHFGDKLLRLEGLMKTQAGKGMARERSEQMKVFTEWWYDEATVDLTSLSKMRLGDAERRDSAMKRSARASESLPRQLMRHRRVGSI